MQCKTWKSTKIIPGGISEYILMPETNLKNDTLKLPEHVSFEDGTLIEPTACVLKGLKRAGLRFKNSSTGDTPLPLWPATSVRLSAHAEGSVESERERVRGIHM